LARQCEEQLLLQMLRQADQAVEAERSGPGPCTDVAAGAETRAPVSAASGGSDPGRSPLAEALC